MGTHVSFIFRGYNPYIGGLKPSFFMVLGSKGVYIPGTQMSNEKHTWLFRLYKGLYHPFL